MDYASKILYFPFKLDNNVTRVDYIYLLCGKLNFTDPTEGEKILDLAIENDYIKENENEELKPLKDHDLGSLSILDIEYDYDKLVSSMEKFDSPSNQLEETVNVALENLDESKAQNIISEINQIKSDKEISTEEACDKYIERQI